jgi:hypothetical protein
MPGHTLSTLQSYIDAGHTISAHHHPGGLQPCNHSADLDLVALAERYGPDFDLVANHDWFVARLRCTACGRKGGMSLIISPPRR